MSNKLIFVMLDGLRQDVAATHMGYMNHLVEQRKAISVSVRSQLPSLSRPMYELLLTGIVPCDSGITTNFISRMSFNKSLFHLARDNGRSTSAAAYHWVSEMYNQSPFDPFTQRIQSDESKPIQHGLFYFADDYPDSHLFADAQHLISTYQSDFIYVHSMGIDNAGHVGGNVEKRYRLSVMTADNLLATVLPYWLSLGYQVIVTSDHGMDSDGLHGGTRDDERNVPLFVLTEKELAIKSPFDQTLIAPLCCFLMGIEPTEVMRPLFDFEGIGDET